LELGTASIPLGNPKQKTAKNAPKPAKITKKVKETDRYDHLWQSTISGGFSAFRYSK
jgi:hypothetical protein